MNIECKDWSDCGVVRGGCCAKGLYGGKPSWGVCKGVCPHYIGPNDAVSPTAAAPIVLAPSYAPGEVAARLFKWLGYAPTSGCGCREFQNKMNEWGWFGCLCRAPEIYHWFREKWKQSGAT